MVFPRRAVFPPALQPRPFSLFSDSSAMDSRSATFLADNQFTHSYMLTRRILVGTALLTAAPLAAQQKRVMTFQDFSAVRGVSDPQLSPDGSRVLYAVRTTDIAANKRTTRIYVIASAGGTPQEFP